MPSKKLGHNSNLTLLPLTVNTSKCRENTLPQLINILQMPPLATVRTKWLKPPLEHSPILQHQPQRIEVWWHLSHRPMPVLPRSWRTTQTSCGNSRLYSRRNEVKSVANAVLTPHPAIIVGRMATKLVALKRVSLVNSRNPATKRRPLERITWEVVRPTGNDIQGRQL
jgi:hypothetical protein